MKSILPRGVTFRRARFIDRPNRFLVRCDLEGQGPVEAFLPNPGRLWELLLPEVSLYVADESPREKTARKTRYTVWAVERDGAPVFLHTHANNAVARWLLEYGRIPSLEHVTVVRAEAPLGRSRFDFLLRERGAEVYMEVKSCTLFGNDMAMFPDAVTERGRRHLLELAALADRGVPSIVLFLVHTDAVRMFMPDYHTDLAFARTMLELRDRLRILPVAVGWNGDLSLKQETRVLAIPWDFLRAEVVDRGSYALIIRLKHPKRIAVGRLGLLPFRAGFYVYVGSAMHGLSSRLARHMRRRKRAHWHIDYLVREADDVVPLPIRSSQRREWELAQAFSAILDAGPAGFGASDSPAETHLFYSPDNPLNTVPFHVVLQRFRMRVPDGARG